MYLPDRAALAADLPLDGSLEVEFDAATGVIRLTGKGAWVTETVEACFREMVALVMQRREQRRPVLVLVDLSECAVQSDEVAAKIGLGAEKVQQPGDRVAIVVRSSLVKAQLRRTLPQPGEIFISASAAETWLMAYSH
ncbi:hypothetical protein [Sphingomonas sp.]|uniref:hypothetical protein n=1 Tax=Sphingomonas sp. TaxID=28214 RepID=UPI001B14BF52|nr:hypothetical protein [Sphingomonas sp.]MBO9712788.1 hypothetical protein [Sphingomonas sp.]